MAKQSIRTAVLIHGCHLQADLDGKKWEEIVYGDKGNGMMSLEGRAVMGLRVAYQFDAEAVIFSTGASERNGVKEGEYTRNYAYAHLEEVALAALMLPDDLKSILDRSWLDLESQNTREECSRNFRSCNAVGIREVIQVSSSWHIPRCHMEGMNTVRQMRANGEIAPDVIAIGDRSDPSGTVILETSHRGDQLKNEFPSIFRQAFKVPPERLDEFQQRQRALFAEFVST